jgi:hypothetical protein
LVLPIEYPVTIACQSTTRAISNHSSDRRCEDPKRPSEPAKIAADKNPKSERPMCQIESPNPIATAESLGFQNDRTNTNAKAHQAPDSGMKLHEAIFPKA